MINDPWALINFTSVALSGDLTCGRARVLWYDGLLKVYTPDGLLREVPTNKPVMRPRFLSTWDAFTFGGVVTLKRKCMTCGGRQWWRLMRIPSEELWERDKLKP